MFTLLSSKESLFSFRCKWAAESWPEELALLCCAIRLWRGYFVFPVHKSVQRQKQPLHNQMASGANDSEVWSSHVSLTTLSTVFYLEPKKPLEWEVKCLQEAETCPAYVTAHRITMTWMTENLNQHISHKVSQGKASKFIQFILWGPWMSVPISVWLLKTCWWS